MATSVEVLAQQFAMISDSTGAVQFMLDCLVSDNHTWSSEVSEYPVESGATITDHVRNKPLNVDIEAIVSNTPIGVVRDHRTVPDESTDALYDHLMKVHEDRRPVTIRTSLRTYENMVLKDLSVPRSSATGNAIRFTASFMQIKVVKNVRGPRVAIPRAQRSSSSNKPAKPLPEAPQFSTLIAVDPKTGHWFDKTINAWRLAALKVKGIWHLYPFEDEHVETHQSKLGIGQEVAKDDAFDGLRFDGRHPNSRVLLLAPSQYVLEKPKK